MTAAFLFLKSFAGGAWGFATSTIGRYVVLAIAAFSLGSCVTSKSHQKREAREIAAAQAATAKKVTALLQQDLTDLYILRAERETKQKELDDAKRIIAKGSPASKNVCPSAGAVVSCDFDPSVRDAINTILSGRKTPAGDTGGVRCGVSEVPGPDGRCQLQGVRHGVEPNGNWLSGLSQLWRKADAPDSQASGGQTK